MSIYKSYMSVKEAAEYFGVSDRSIYRRVAEGLLKKTKVGGRTVFAIKEIERFAKQNTGEIG
ncbi:MAG: helix-turn-helix domain-containing protein [Phycisphaerales bacterium]